MRKLLPAMIVTALAIVLGWTPKVFAGVVMAETSIAKGPAGESASQSRTVYVQGNKQKVERQEIAAITDLDKSIVYIIDKKDRAYTEVPLQTLIASAPGAGESVRLNQTGETRTIANHQCREYRATKGNKLERVIISACVSTSAPGAEEVSAFERKMAQQLKGGQLDSPTPPDRAALMLEKQSIVSFRVPASARGESYHTTSVVANTRVNQIEVKQLPEDTFKPPRGFSKLDHQHRKVPPATPNVPHDNVPNNADHTIQIMHLAPVGFTSAFSRML